MPNPSNPFNLRPIVVVCERRLSVYIFSEIREAVDQVADRQPLPEGLRSAERQFTVSPNPFTDHVGIRMNAEKEGDFVFTLYDTNGKTVAQKTYTASAGSNEWSLPLDREIPTGTYALVMTDQKGNVDSCLIVKAK